MKLLRILPTYTALLIVSLLFLFPFYWVVISSLKSVEGISLRPPSMYPAEATTTRIEAMGHDVAKVDDKIWLRLSGDFFLQLDGFKPTQLVKELPHNVAIMAQSKPVVVIFEKVPIEKVNGKDGAVVAKLVQNHGDTFDETLFVTSIPAKPEMKIDVVKNPEHSEVRHLSLHTDNFGKALEGPEATIGGKSAGFLLFMRNSAFIAIMAVIGQVLASSLVAFGFSRLNFKGRDFWFVLLIATLMVPAQVTLIPLFTIYKSIGWIDTFFPLIVPHFTAGAFNVFLIRQFMLTMPKELDESASMDGATPFRIYRSIIFPMCTPVLIVVGLFTFVAGWQDVMGPLIYLDNPNYRTVSLGLEYFRSPYVDNRPLLMAAAVLAMLPVAGLFLIVQRYIMSGISTTGLK